MPPHDTLLRLLSASDLPADAWEDGAEELLRFHGLEGLAVARHREAGEAFLPADVVDAFEHAYRASALTTTLCVEAGLRARDTLRDAGIASLLFKGAGLVAGDVYGDPGARRMDDADLLVREEDAVAAVALLSKVGFTPVGTWEPSRVGWADSVTFHDTSAPEGTAVALDLHWRTGYTNLRFGGAGESMLWHGADLDSGLPSPDVHLVLTAEHFLKHLRFKVHMPAFADMTRLARRVEDWDGVFRRVDASRLRDGLMALGVAAMRELDADIPRRPGPAPPQTLVRTLSPSKLAGQVRPVEGRLPGLLHRWKMLGGPWGVARDVWEAAWPSSRWLEARFGSGGVRGRLHYWGDVLRWIAYRGRSPASPNQELFDPRARE